MYPHISRSEMIPFVPSSAKRVLDVGCNTGGFGEALKAVRTVEVWGLEPNEDACRMASRVLDRVINTQFSRDADVPNEYFDVVTFNDVLEHLVDPWQALTIAKSKLREGGAIVASIPNLLHIDNLEHMLIERDFRYEPDGIRDRTHLRFFTKVSIVRMFSDCGFDVCTIAGINERWWTTSVRRRVLFRLFPERLQDTKFVQFAVVASPILQGISD